MNKTGKTALHFLCVVLSVLMIMSVFAVLSVSADIIPEYQTFTSGHTTVTVHFDSSKDKFTTTVSAIPGTDGKMEDYSNSNKKFGDYFLTGDLIVAEGVTHIGNYSFVGSTEGGYYTGFEKITLPKSLKTIGAHAFEKQGGKEKRNIYIPVSVEQIGEEAFASYQGGNLRFFDMLNGESTASSSSLRKIGAKAFYNSTVSAVVFPTTCSAEIGEDAFLNCSELESVTLREFMGPYGSHCFGYTYSASNFSLKDNFKITVPTKTCQGYYYAQNNGIDVESTSNDDSGNTGGCKWTYTDSDKTLKISGSGKMADYSRPADRPWHLYASDIQTLIIESGVTGIGSYAFRDSTVDSVSLPDTVTEIGEAAFFNCPKLSDLTLGANVKTVGGYAFAATALKDVTIPESVETLNDYSFGYNDTGYSYVKVSGFTIYGKEGSAAETYANNNGFAFVSADDPKIPIAEVDITVEEPEYGKVWNFMPKLTGNYKCTGIATRLSGEIFDTDAPLAEGEYEIEYILEAKDGYAFIKGAGDSVYTAVNINGKPAASVEKYSDKDISKVIQVTYTFEIKKPEETEPQTTTAPAVVTAKKANPMKVTAKTKTVKLKKLKKKAQSVKAITVKKAQGKVTYKLKSVTKKIKKLTKISSKGVITIKKWKKAKKGTYKIVVNVTAKGNTNYKKLSKKVTVKIKVK